MKQHRITAALAAAFLPWALPAAHAQTDSTLPEVQVKASGPAETATGPVEGYRAKRSASGTKTDTPLAETPQSISVVPRAMMEDMGAQSLQDALRYVPGVRSDTYGFDNRGDWAMIRGTSFTQYQDGLKMLFGSYNNTRPDPYALERVEVVRGPASVLYGQGGFGGLVNMVSKRPLPETQREVTAELGSYNRKQLAVDLTGAATADRTFLYRLVALGRDSGTQVDHVPDDRMLIAPSLTWRPSTATALTVHGNVQDDQSGSSVGFFPWRGTLFDAPNGRIPTNTFISEPGYDDYRAKQRALGYEFSHAFSPVWTLRQNVRQSNSDVTYKSLYARFAPRPDLNPDNRTINRTIVNQFNEADTLTADTQLQAKWVAGRFDNVFLAGIDYQKATLGGARGAANAPAIDVYAPVYGNFTPVAALPIADTVQRQTGTYLQHQLKFDQHWLGVLGFRRDWAKSDTANAPASRLDTDADSKRIGLGYLADGGWMPYFSYSESFSPIGGVDLFGKPFQPQTSEQNEVGIKYQPVGTNNTYSAALFDIRETNRRTPDPTTPGNSIQIGEARSKGLELEALFGVTRALDVVATYAYTDAKVTRANGPEQGKHLASIPEHTASVWGRYRFALANTPGFLGALGVRYVGESWDGLDQVRTPDVTLFDAMFGWEQGPWRLSLNALNLTDKVHVTTCLARGDCFYGNCRSVVARVAYRF